MFDHHPYVIFAGNVATGKSTLARLFADRYGFSYLGEPVDELSFVNEFFADMERWSFHHQLDFLLLKGQQENAAPRDKPACGDRSLADCFHVFTRLSHQEGWISDKEWLLLSRLYTELSRHALKPDLVVHLTAPLPTLMARIVHRARRHEAHVESSWLEKVEEGYALWTATLPIPVLRLDTEALDFLREPARLDGLLRRIAALLPPFAGAADDLDRHGAAS